MVTDCVKVYNLSLLLEPSHQRPTQNKGGGRHMAAATHQPGHKSEVGEVSLHFLMLIFIVVDPASLKHILMLTTRYIVTLAAVIRKTESGIHTLK